MSKRTRNTRPTGPSVEPLEGRIVMSAVPTDATVSTSAFVKGVSYLFLNGSVSGTFRHDPGRPEVDVGSKDILRGSGQLTNFGRLRLTGTLFGSGMIVDSPLTGTIRLANAKGSVTLQLEGPVSPGFTPPHSGSYRFTVQGGTGAYQHVVGTGTVDVTLGRSSFRMKFTGAPNNF